MIMKLNLDITKDTKEVEKYISYLMGYYVFSNLEFIHYMEQVIF